MSDRHRYRHRSREGSPQLLSASASELPSFLSHPSKPLPLPPHHHRHHHHNGIMTHDHLRQPQQQPPPLPQKNRSCSRWRKNKRRYDEEDNYPSHHIRHHHYYDHPVDPSSYSLSNHYYYDERRRSNPYKRYRRSASVSSRSDHTSCSSSVNDEIGHYLGRKGDCITRRYEIEKELGKGTFGKVFQCYDHKYKDIVALKVVRSIKRYIKSAEIEAAILNDVYDRMQRHDSPYCVKMYSHFKYGDHFVMVFETLGLSLYDLVRRNDYVGLPMEFVRSVSKQLLQALNFLQSIHLVHTDLKLENVLFVSSALEARTIVIHGERKEIFVPVNPRIKLIDFGGATYEHDEERSRVINTRQYRSPEVLLELEWSYPSDIWSAACIIAEVYAGDLLFQTHAQLEHLAMVEKLCGRFPGHMVRESVHKKRYFDSHGRVKCGELSRSSVAFVDELLPLEGKRGFFSVQPEDWQSGIVELMKGLLTIDPSVRLTAQQALNATFFTRKESS